MKNIWKENKSKLIICNSNLLVYLLLEYSIYNAITPNVTGILIPLKSSEAIADAVLSLCKNNEKRIEMGRKGRELAEMCFDIGDVIETHLKLYKSTFPA